MTADATPPPADGPVFSEEARADAARALRELVDTLPPPTHDLAAGAPDGTHSCICGMTFPGMDGLLEHISDVNARQIIDALLAAPGVRREVEALRERVGTLDDALLVSEREALNASERAYDETARLHAALEAAERERARLRHNAGVLLGIAENIAEVHSRVNMDTDEDRALHASAVAAFREALDTCRAALAGDAQPAPALVHDEWRGIALAVEVTALPAEWLHWHGRKEGHSHRLRPEEVGAEEPLHDHEGRDLSGRALYWSPEAPDAAP